MTYKKDLYFLFLQILRERKLWKAEDWYPFISKLFLNSKLSSAHKVHYSCSNLTSLSSGVHIRKQNEVCQLERQLSQSFIKLGQSEKELSQLITILIKKLV